MPAITYVYPNSKHEAGGSEFCIAIVDGVKSLVIRNKSENYSKFKGVEKKVDGITVKICKMNRNNAKALRGLFPFTKPTNHAGKPLTIGLGDRLGLASPGHIRLIRDMDVFPVLAQQSVRELVLTDRTFADVLDAASWAVFQEGYTKGWGADGDHLKHEEEVETALNCGYTMITLDCSDMIRRDIDSISAARIDQFYAKLPEPDHTVYETVYMGKSFKIDGAEIRFTQEELKKIVMTYYPAVDHIFHIYHFFIASNASPVDFEVSIDETQSATSPAAHFFIANELKRLRVECVSIAPRFCGEFQKGIDYKGDVGQFEKEFIIHDKIAKHFGYKLSIHSGSDKFRVFPIIRKESGGIYHLKTAGTNWLEALRTIAEKDPAFFREIVKFSLANLEKAKFFYRTTENTANIPDPDKLNDDELPGLLDNEDARQVLHITYGQVLSAKDVDGLPMFRDGIYEDLLRYEEEYYNALIKHIGLHLL